MEYGYAMAEDAEETTYKSHQPKNKKKVGFFTRWFNRKCKEAWESSKQEREPNLVGLQEAAISKSLRIGRNESSIDQPERAIQFTVYQANGGRVVETRRYDRQKDRHSNGLYVITSEMDFGKEIDKIITMENLKS